MILSLLLQTNNIFKKNWKSVDFFNLFQLFHIFKEHLVETLWRFRSAFFRKKTLRSAIPLWKNRLCTPYFSVVGEIEVKHQCIRASKSCAQACWWNWPLGQVLWFDWATALDEGGLIGLAMDLVVLASAALKKANDYFLHFEKNPITKFGLKYSLIEIYEWLFSNYRCVFNWPRNYFLPTFRLFWQKKFWCTWKKMLLSSK